MENAMKWLVTALLLLSAVAVAQEVLPFANNTERQLYQQLTAELRCPQCQNQNIADSNAIVAVDMREKTYQLIREGKNRQQVLEYMINRYGDFVHYQPPLTRYTLWLWLLPVLMLLALAVIGIYRRARYSNGTTAAAPEALDAELNQLIERYRSKKP
jgi:cytochrome c-type biogenesis protein CcmH